MKRCSKCGHGRAYRLGDGRLKCRACGHRFSWTSVWNSVRLPRAIKQRLLDMFVLGVPSYRQRFASDTSDVSRERFYRLARACCGKAEGLTAPFEAIAEARGLAPVQGERRRPGSDRRIIVVGMVHCQGRIRAYPTRIGDGHPSPDQLQLAPSNIDASDGNTSHGHAVFNLRGEHVLLRTEKGTQTGGSGIGGVDGFWNHARATMLPHRAVPHRYFHLYLAEACYRYNHRSENLGPCLLSLMKTLSIQELRPIFGRNA